MEWNGISRESQYHDEANSARNYRPTLWHRPPVIVKAVNMGHSRTLSSSWGPWDTLHVIGLFCLKVDYWTLNCCPRELDHCSSVRVLTDNLTRRAPAFFGPGVPCRVKKSDIQCARHEHVTKIDDSANDSGRNTRKNASDEEEVLTTRSTTTRAYENMTNGGTVSSAGESDTVRCVSHVRRAQSIQTTCLHCFTAGL